MYPKKKAPNKKLGEQAMKGVMIGYEDMDGTKAYRIFIPEISKVIVTPDVTFMDFKITTTGKIADVNKLTDQLYNFETSLAEKKTQEKQRDDTTTTTEVDNNIQKPNVEIKLTPLIKTKSLDHIQNTAHYTNPLAHTSQRQ